MNCLAPSLYRFQLLILGYVLNEHTVVIFKDSSVKNSLTWFHFILIERIFILSWIKKSDRNQMILFCSNKNVALLLLQMPFLNL